MNTNEQSKELLNATQSKMNVVGQSVERLDAIKKVTGTAVFADDIQFSRPLYAQVVRSPHAHANILSIDLTAAQSLPGVRSVITGECYKKRAGLYLEDKNFIAVGKARYRGEPVAAVAADSPEIARRACELVKVEYEVLPAVTDSLEGMKPDAPIIHPDLGSYKVLPIFYPKPGTNISHHYVLRKGDADKAFEEADRVFDHSFYIPHVQHVPIEPHACTAQYMPDGDLTIWAACQSPFAVRRALAETFDFPLNKIRVISKAVGGGFGCKAGTTLEGIVIPLAMLNPGRPVKMTYTREDEFQNAYVRQGLHINIKTAVRKDGKIIGSKNVLAWDGGAYTEYGVNIVKAAGWGCVGPYDIENIATDSYCVYTNHPVGGPYRGFGMCEIHFGIEQNIDMIAHEMGIDPLEMRKLNGIREGGKSATGQTINVAGYQECLERASQLMEMDKPSAPSGSPTKLRGKGIAGGWKAPSMPTDVASSVIIRMNEDGTFMLLASCHDIGQGSDTVMAQIAAETLTVPVEKISVRTGDTDHTPYEWQTVASRSTYCAGNATKLAAEDIRNKILDLAQIKMGTWKNDLYLEGGYVCRKFYPDQKVPLAAFALGLTLPDQSGIGGPMIGVGSFVVPNNIAADKKTGLSPKPVAFWSMGVNGAEVEVDIETGKVKVLKMVSVFDAGKVINPAMYEGQAEGAMVQAMGTALYEELKLKDGRVMNPSFVDYKIPAFEDMPEMIVEAIEKPEPTGPYGARGIGEITMVPGAPAIANAVANAIGVRFLRMPLTPDVVLAALREKKAAENK